MTTILRFLHLALKPIQSRLAFDDWELYTEFNHSRGLGRVSLISSLLAVVWGIHFMLAIVFIITRTFLFTYFLSSRESNNANIDSGGKQCILSSDDAIILEEIVSKLCIWCIFVVLLMTFHILEFFVTVIYNPAVATADNFLINHSIPYTAAMIASSIEFWIVFLVKGTKIQAMSIFTISGQSESSSSPPTYDWCIDSNTCDTDTSSDTISTKTLISMIGFSIVCVSQIIRTLAMSTCGGSFNHLIQTSKKDSHVLITHGIYKYLRHPSYVGFYYWSIGTQLLLNNVLHTFLFGLLSLGFFRRRIPYEEASLLEHFPNEYPSYMKLTYIGIPFIYNKYNNTLKNNENDNENSSNAEDEYSIDNDNDSESKNNENENDTIKASSGNDAVSTINCTEYYDATNIVDYKKQ